MKYTRLNIDEKTLKKLNEIARNHRMDPQDVLNRILDDCVEMYMGQCTVTCGLCNMRVRVREDKRESRK